MARRSQQEQERRQQIEAEKLAAAKERERKKEQERRKREAVGLLSYNDEITKSLKKYFDIEQWKLFFKIFTISL